MATKLTIGSGEITNNEPELTAKIDVGGLLAPEEQIIYDKIISPENQGRKERILNTINELSKVAVINDRNYSLIEDRGSGSYYFPAGREAYESFRKDITQQVLKSIIDNKVTTELKGLVEPAHGAGYLDRTQFVGSGSVMEQMTEYVDEQTKARTAGFDYSKLNAISSKPLTDMQRQAFALEYAEDAKKRFEGVVGREATQGELASIFNRANFSELAGAIGNEIENFFADPSGHIANMQGMVNVGSANIIQRLQPKFQLVTEANEQLKSAGKQLTDSQIRQITSETASIEDVQKLATQFVASTREQAVSEALPTMAAQEQAAITGLETSLGESAQKMFEENRPFTERILAARGLLRGGSLPEAYARQLGQLSTARESQISPLKASTSLAAIQRGYQNTLRQALEAGQSLQQATGFASQMLSADRQRAWQAGQQQQQNIFSQNLANQQAALQMAMLGKYEEPSGFEQFLKYGLPATASAAGGAAGMFAAMGCWVAAAVFDGWDDFRTHFARYAINNVWERNLIGRFLKSLYWKFGERLADRVRKYAWLRKILKPVFHLIYLQGFFDIKRRFEGGK